MTGFKKRGNITTLTVRLKSGLLFWLTESGINIGQTGMTNQWILMFHLQFPLLGRKFKALLVTEITLWLLSKHNVAYKKTTKGW